MRNWAENSATTRRLVRRFVAGETLDQALDVSGRLLGDRLETTLDRLGENAGNAGEARQAMLALLRATQQVRERGLPSTVSVKLTQLGLDFSEGTCRDNLACLVEAAREAGTFVEIDMEASRYVHRTLALAREMHSKWGNVRAVVQAYLYRSMQDTEQLCREGIPVRLCKGAYLEPAEIAYPRKRDVDKNYRRLMEILLNSGLRPALATHDPRMIGEAERRIQDLQLHREQYEFQMLYGVRRDLQRELVAKGHRVRLYVPYGKAWYPYFMRRLAERPANLLFLARQLGRS